MAIHFQCHGCGSDFRVPETMAGTAARCNRCGTIVTIPVPGLSFEPELSGLAPLDPLAASQPSRPQATLAKPAKLNASASSGGLSPLAWLAIGGGGGVAALVLFGVMMRVLFSGGAPAANPAAPPVAAASAASSSGETIEWAPSAAPTYAANPPRGFTPTPAPVTVAPPATVPPTGSSDPVKEPAPTVTALPQPAAWANEDDPLAIPAASSAAGPAAPAAAAEWGASGGPLRIPFNDRQAVTFGPIGCPVLVVGNDVYHLPTNRLVQSLQGEYEQRAHTVLSGDGQWFAAAMKSPNQQDTPVQVWKTATGEKVLTVPGHPDRYADLIAFTRNKYLVIGGRDSGALQVWDVETGKQAKNLAFPGSRVEKGKLAFTADGQYFAAVADKQLLVVKTATGQPAAVMGAPLSMERSPAGQAVIVRNNRVVADSRRADPSDAVFVYAWLQDLEFSPDGQELAGISTHPRPRLLCWDNRGKLVLDEPLDQLPSMAFWEHEIQWLPDGSGWVISGNVFDRATKRVVLGVRKPFGEDLRVHALDRNTLIGAFPHRPGELTALQIPWDRIDASMKAMKDGAPAILSPNTPVSINIQLAGLRGDQQETARAIGDALVQRLARDGVRVERGQATTFQVKFSESAGDQLPIYERQSPFDFRGHDTGRRATEAKGSLVVELLAAGESQPLWRDTLTASNASSFREEINDATVRKSMLEDLSRQINELNMPYFIPKAEDLLALPVVLQ